MHGETIIKQYSNDTYHVDKYGNKVTKKCTTCGGNVGIVLNKDETIINGQCLQCHKIMALAITEPK